MDILNSSQTNYRNIDTSEFSTVRIFYFLVLFDFIRDSLNALNAILVNPADNFMFPYTLQFLGLFEKNALGVALIVSGIFINFLLLVKPHSQSARISSLIFFVISKGFIFSATRFNHHYIPMVWALLCLSLYSTETSEKGRALYKKVYSLLLFCLASFYFFPGLWKLIYGVTQKEIWNQQFGANTIASFFLSQGQNAYLGQFMIEHELLSYFGFLFIILFQLSSIYAWWNPKYQRLWAIFVLVFHTISVLVLNVNFFVAAAVTFLFFFMSPFLDRDNDWLARLLSLAKLGQKKSD